MATEQVTGFTKSDLQEMMVALIKAAKEPTEAEKAKQEEERAKQLRTAKENAEIAKAEESRKRNRWDGCPHSQMFNGRVFPKWGGQVNSNGMVNPVCNICHVEAPPFSAKLLPDEGKQGVNFESWVKCDKELLSELHKKSFTGGKCSKSGCFVCDPKKA